MSSFRLPVGGERSSPSPAWDLAVASRGTHPNRSCLDAPSESQGQERQSSEHIHALGSREPTRPTEQEGDVHVLDREEMGQRLPMVTMHQATQGKQEEPGLCSDVTFSAGPPLGTPLLSNFFPL